MKIRRLTFLLIAGLLSFFACDNDYPNSSYNEQTNTHNYGTSTEGKTESEKGPVNQSPIGVRNEEVRDIWQNYRVVINKLGDLKDKVVADIGAGPYGYFTLRIANNSEVKKIIAIDIDKDAVRFIEDAKIILDKDVANRIETRLVEPHDPHLNNEEADIVIIVNTYVYLDDPIQYLKNLKKGISKDGKLVIIDFKKRNTPVGPPLNYRKAIGVVEQDLAQAGYANVESDDQTLDYQYIVIAQPGLQN